MLSVHTSPLEQPGTGDAGGLNVYVVEVARRLAERGTEVEIFTRATSSEADPLVELMPGVHGASRRRRPPGRPGQERPPRPAVRLHRRRDAGRGARAQRLVRRRALPLLALRAGGVARGRTAGTCRSCTPCTRWRRSRTRTSRTATSRSRRAARSARSRSCTPRTAWSPTPTPRVPSSSTSTGRTLTWWQWCRRGSTSTSSTRTRTGADRAAARQRLGLPADGTVLLFAGRIQPLKAPHVVVRAVAEMLRRDPSLRPRLLLAVVGGPAAAVSTVRRSCRRSPTTWG